MKNLSKGKKITIIVVSSILIICLLFFTLVTTIASAGRQDNFRYVKQYVPFYWDWNIIPDKNEDDGSYMFVSDKPLKIMQLSDIHLGGGWLTKGIDRTALDTIATMIIVEKPDLVVVTGNLVNANPIYGASLNNLEPIRVLSMMLEQLKIYYTFCLGVKDSPRYNLFTREYLNSFLLSDQWEYSLYTDLYNCSGVGNQIIKVKNTDGIITQAIICMDSNEYNKDKTLTGLKGDQISWYKEELLKIDSENKTHDPNCKMLGSVVFMNTPIYEYQEAYSAFEQNSYEENEDIKIIGDIQGYKGYKVSSCSNDNEFFETVLELGSTTSIYSGHDEANNLGIIYKGVNLEYCYAIDYLTHQKDSTYNHHRGCKTIYLNPDGTSESENQLFSQSKYEIDLSEYR